jgi:hypothetical protein
MTRVVRADFDIQWPQEDELTIRRLVTRSRSIPTGKHWSVTLGRMTEWESSVECYGQKLVDVCPAITCYFEQPFRLRYWWNGKRLCHIPDLLAYPAVGRPWVIEFKADGDRKLEEARQRSEIVAPFFCDVGFDYHIVMESSLLRGSYLQNARYILRYGRASASVGDFNFASDIFEVTGDLTLSAFSRAFKIDVEGIRAACRLLISGHIAIDMALPISAETRLSWRGKPDYMGDLSWLQAAFAVIK